MANRGRPRKNPYEDLPNEFKIEVDGADEARCRQVLSKIGIDQSELMTAKKVDQDLAEKAETHKEAGLVYRDGTKMNKTKTSYIVDRLKAMGKI